MNNGDESFESIERVLNIPVQSKPRESIDQVHYREYIERAIACGRDVLLFSSWILMGRPTE